MILISFPATPMNTNAANMNMSADQGQLQSAELYAIPTQYVHLNPPSQAQAGMQVHYPSAEII